MNKNAQECDADHAEGATSGTSDGGIILSLCMNLSSFDNKSITEIFLTSENRFFKIK